MKSEKISTEIAALERKVKSAKNAVVKKVLEKKIDSLRQELKKEEDGVSKLAKAKKKIREMSESDFNKFIKNLSKKEGFSFLKSMTKDEIKRDIQRTAKPVGWRFRGDNTKKPTRKDIREDNNVYYEGRRNRSDVSRSVRLATGGGVDSNENLFSKGEVLFIFKGNKADDFYESLNNMMPDHEITMVNNDKVQAFFGNYSDLEDAMQMAKSYGMSYQGKYATGGGVDINELDMPVIRTQFEDEEYEYAKGGSIGDSGMITDKNSMFVGKMGTITGDLGNMYEVMVLDNGNKRTVLVKKNSISVVSDEYANGGNTGEPHRSEMKGMMKLGGSTNEFKYEIFSENTKTGEKSTVALVKAYGDIPLMITGLKMGVVSSPIKYGFKQIK